MKISFKYAHRFCHFYFFIFCTSSHGLSVIYLCFSYLAPVTPPAFTFHHPLFYSHLFPGYITTTSWYFLQCTLTHIATETNTHPCKSVDTWYACIIPEGVNTHLYLCAHIVQMLCFLVH